MRGCGRRWVPCWVRGWRVREPTTTRGFYICPLIHDNGCVACSVPLLQAGQGFSKTLCIAGIEPWLGSWRRTWRTNPTGRATYMVSTMGAILVGGILERRKRMTGGRSANGQSHGCRFSLFIFFFSFLLILLVFDDCCCCHTAECLSPLVCVSSQKKSMTTI